MLEITPELLLQAYRIGVFPMGERRDDPKLYWLDPQLRAVLPLDGFHLPKRPKQRAIGSQVTVMTPALRHLARRVGNTAAAKGAREVLHQTAPVIVGQPVFQIMQTRKIFARADAVPITIRLDVTQQCFRRPVRFRLIQHARKRERDFKKRPAIHSLKIH